MRRIVSALAIALLFFCGAAAAQNLVSRYVAGQDYAVVASPAPAPNDGKIHVAEFFLYSCPHCYHFEPTLEAWQKKLDADVAFTHVPVLFARGGELYARLYYTEARLGVLGRLHDPVFDAIHRRGKLLNTRAAMRRFMVAHGVDGDRFNQVFTSDAVSRKIARAGDLMRQMRVTAVPSMGVAGRYWVSGRAAGSNKRMLAVVNYLIQKQRRRAGR